MEGTDKLFEVLREKYRQAMEDLKRPPRKEVPLADLVFLPPAPKSPYRKR